MMSLQFRKTVLIDLLLLVLVGGIVFYPSLNIYFLSDNISHILRASESVATRDFRYFRPLAELSLVADLSLWGMNAFGFHLTNLLLHLTNAILLYLLAGQLMSARFFALTAALLFLLHPVHSLSIFWISGRSDMLCGIFFLLSLSGFIYVDRSGKQWARWGSLAGFLLALFSKEMALSLPLLLLFYVLIFREGTLKNRALDGLRRTLPYWFLLAGYLLFRLWMIGENAFSNEAHQFSGILQLVKNLATYAGLLMVPGGHVEIANIFRAHPNLFLALSLLVLIGGLISLRWVVRDARLLFFCGFILITLLPVIRLMMRWYLYIPSLGFCLAAAYLLQILYRRFNTRQRFNPAYLFAALLFLTYGFFIHQEQQRWWRAGEISRDVSGQIAREAQAQQLDSCLFLNLSSELEEVPVNLYGLETLVNYRLADEFHHERHLKIEPVCYISWQHPEDLDHQQLERLDERSFRISLEATGSFFVFPEHERFHRSRAGIEIGTVLETANYRQIIEQLDLRREVVAVQVDVTNPRIALLYQLDGRVFTLAGNE